MTKSFFPRFHSPCSNFCILPLHAPRSMKFIVTLHKFMNIHFEPSFMFYLRLRIDLLAILKKNLNRTTFVYIFKNFRICTIAIEALTPLERTSRIKMYKNIARSRLFCRIAKRSIGSRIIYDHSDTWIHLSIFSLPLFLAFYVYMSFMKSEG